MTISELMQAMADAGAPMEAIIIAVRALEDRDAAAAEAQAEIEQRRAADRERKRRQRAKEQDISDTVTGQSRDMSDDVTGLTPFPSPSPSFPPNPQTNPTPTHTRNNTPARKGTRLAEDWMPEPIIGKSEEMLANWPPGAVERELEKFRNYWLAKAGKDACKTNWQRTWINWLIQADERIAKHDGSNRKSGAKTHRGRDGFLNACFEAGASQAAHLHAGDG